MCIRDRYALSADTWTKITHTFPGYSGLTFETDNGVGIQFMFIQYFGTSYTSGSTVDQWVTYTGSTSTPDDTADWWTTNNATFEITGLQLEVGSTATAFEHRSFAEELISCKRYFQNHAPNYSDHMMWGTGRAESNTGRIGIPVSVPMRAAPTVATTANRLMRYDGSASDSTDTPTIFAAGSWLSESNIYTLDFSGHSLSHNNMYQLTSGGGTGITLDSEL